MSLLKKVSLFCFFILFVFTVVSFAAVRANSRMQSPLEAKLADIEQRMSSIEKKFDRILENQEKMFKEFEITRRWIKRN